MSSPALSERAARAALAHFFTPENIAGGLDAEGAVGLWRRLVTDGGMPRLAAYDAEEELSAAQLTARFVIPGDPDWPALLDGSEVSGPLGVWLRGDGDLAELSECAVAFTGNHYATAASLSAARDMARDVARAGRTVVATLDFGIANAAHAGAHQVPAPTLAVLPCGLDQYHPRDQDVLARRVLGHGGLLVSSCRPGQPACGYHVAGAARLTAALARAAVMFECTRDSTPLDVAAEAHRLGRVLLAVPASVAVAPDVDARGRCEGNNQLLSPVRARPVLDASGVLTALS
ncbi:DNA-processing protein DprA [Streptomyces sp. NPDC059718]